MQNLLSSILIPASYGSLTGLGFEILSGNNQPRRLVDRPAFRLAAVFAGVNFLATRVLCEKGVRIISSLITPAAYGALTGLAIETLSGRNQLHLVNRPTLRAAVVIAGAHLLSQSALPETAVGAVGGVLLSRAVKEITAWFNGDSENQAYRNELLDELGAMTIGATVAAVAGLGFRIMLEGS